MKKIFLFIFIVCAAFSSKAQYPNAPQTIGNDSNVVIGKGGLKGRLINWTFTDTSAANLQRIKDYPFAQIATTSDSSMWFRYNNMWIKLGGAQGGASGNFWSKTGDLFPVIPSGFGIGTNDATNLPFKTNGSTRLILPSTGIVRSSAAINKYIMMDTSTKEMYYGDGGGGGGSQTWQQALTTGSTLTQDNTAFIDAFNFFFKGSTSGDSSYSQRFYGSLGAFRAGVATDDSWNIDSIGENSIASGYNSVAVGTGSVSMGDENKSRGNASVALGGNNKSTGYRTIALGHNNQSVGFISTAIGEANISTEDVSVAIGLENEARGISATAMGAKAIVTGNYSFGINLSFNPYTLSDDSAFGINAEKLLLERLPQAANTTNKWVQVWDDVTKNWERISKDSIGGEQNFQDVLTTGSTLTQDNVAFIDAFNFFFKGGLNGDSSYSQRFYGSLGAFRSGVATNDVWNIDSIGENSFVSGYNSAATGSTSVSMGDENASRGNASIALGGNNISTGYRSLALGHNNISTGFISAAIGEANIVTDNTSIAIGTQNEARASNATAMGADMKVYNPYSFGINLSIIPDSLQVDSAFSVSAERYFLKRLPQASNMTNKWVQVWDDVTKEWERISKDSVGGSGSGITELTGDVTAGPGSGSQAATLANTAVTPGSYTNVSATVDAKGRITAMSSGSGGVTSVSGTTNRVTSTGGATPVIDISSSYVGQSSITTLGTVTTGTLSTGAVVSGVTMTLGSDGNYDLYYRNSSGVLTRLANGTTGQFLSANTASAPTWATPSSTTPTLQQVFTAGSTLTGVNSVTLGTSLDFYKSGTGGKYSQIFQDVDRIYLQSTTGTSLLKSFIQAGNDGVNKNGISLFSYDGTNQVGYFSNADSILMGKLLSTSDFTSFDQTKIIFKYTKDSLKIRNLPDGGTISDSLLSVTSTGQVKKINVNVIAPLDTTRIVTGPTGYYQSAYSPRLTFMYEKADRFSFASDSTITPVTTDSTRHWYIPALTLVASGDWVGGNTATQKLVGYTTPNNSKISVYQVSAKVLVTAVGGGGTLTTTCTYTDEGNTSRTVTFYSMGSAVAGMTATGISSYPVLGEIQCYPNTEVSVTTTLTIGTATYDATSSIVFIRNYDQ